MSTQALPCAALLSALAASLNAQTPTRAPASTFAPTISATRNEVVLDVVARDKKGRPVRDLESSQFQVFDDGAPVQITGFRLVERNTPAGSARESKAAPPAADPKMLDPLRQIQLVTLVFERLGPDGRGLAREAALDLIKGEPEQNVYYAVFAIDQHLSALQPFTNDRAALKAAIERATSGAYASFGSDSEQIKRNLQGVAGGPGIEGQGNVERVQNIAAGARDTSQRVMAQMLLSILQFDESMSIQQQGRSSVFSLLSLVKEQYRLPGRKTLMYFSEGLVVPENLDDPFRAVIGAANRANVSVYAVDTRGLLITRQNVAGSSALADAAAASRTTVTRLSGAVTPQEVKALDRAQESTRLNAQNALADLAESTGGFLIANSNDLRNPLRRVNEDLRTYYEISYSPDIKQYDGRFRKLSVKVSRADVRLQSRAGYFALPPNAGPSLLPYEVPLLAALAAAPFPRDVEFHSAALRFAPVPGGAGVALVIEVPLKSVSFVEDRTRNSYRTHFSVLALFKDASGNVVQKFSQDIPYEGPLEKLSAFQSGKFIYTRHFNAAAGRYTLETAVLDRENGKLGARKAAFVLGPPAPGLNLSSLSLARRFDQMEKSAEDPEDPFHFPGGKVTPTLESAVAAGKGAAVALYFVIYPDQSSAEKPQLTLEFYSEGKLAAQAAPELPVANPDGHIPYIATSPLENMKAGQYEVRVVVKQGAAAREERTLFTVE